MAISKVVYGNDTLIDLSEDTVDANHLLQGYTAHKADGTKVVGTYSGGGGGSMPKYTTKTLYGGESVDTSTVNVDASTLPYKLYASDTPAVVYDGDIHLIGGYYGQFKHYSFDGETWTELSDNLPYNFYKGYVIVFDGEIHILGGDGSSYDTKHYKWDGSTWTEVSTLPYQFKLCPAVVYRDELHILGSVVSGNGTKHYKFKDGVWESVSTIPISMDNSASAVVFNDEIHVFKLTSHYKFKDGVWESVSTIPVQCTGYQSAVVYDDEIHLLGNIPNSSESTQHYKWDGLQWVYCSTLPYKFSGDVIVYNDEIHALGSGGDGLHHLMAYKFGKVPGWDKIDDQYLQHIKIPQLQSNDIVFTSFNRKSMSDAEYRRAVICNISCINQIEGKLTFSCDLLPANDIDINVVFQEGEAVQ